MVAITEGHPEGSGGSGPTDSGHSGQALSTESFAVHVVVKRDELIVAGRSPGDIQASLDTLGAFAPELNVIQISRRDLDQGFQKSGLYLSVEIMTVLETLGILYHGLSDLWMTVAEVGNVYAAAEIDVLIAVDIFESYAVAGFEGYLEKAYLGRIALHELVGSFLDGPGFGPRRGYFDIGDFVNVNVGPVCTISVHRLLPYVVVFQLLAFPIEP